MTFKAKIVWPHISGTKNLRRQKEENHKFGFVVDYIMTYFQKQANNKNNTYIM